jgi:amino acid transporter
MPSLMSHNHLTGVGYGAALVMMGLLVFVNSFGIQSTTKASNFFSTWKLIIPGLAILTYILSAKDTTNLNTHVLGGFAPYGLHGIFSALAVAGVVFSFNGFQIAILMASETKNPQKSIPRAIIGSILIGILLYAMLQFSFLLAIPKQFIAHGWHNLSFQGDAGPLAGLAAVIGASSIASLLYVDAVVAPMSAGLVYVTSTSRILYSLSANGYIHSSAAKINHRGIPMNAIWINFVVGMLAFLPFPGWQSMVAFLSSIMVSTYAIVPICLVTLRKQHPNLERPFELPICFFIGLMAFFLCNLMLYWTGFETLIKLFSCLMVGIIIYCLSALRKKKWKEELPTILKSTWLIAYFGGMCLISLFGSFGNGLNLYKHNIEYVLLAIFSFLIIQFAKLSGITTQQSLQNINSIMSKNNG